MNKMPAGRPRTVSLSPEEMHALGKEMVAWVLENKPIHLSQWWCIEKMYTDKEFDTIHVCPEFFPYYEKCIKIIGLNYLLKNSKIEPNIKNRWQRVYFKDLKKSEDEDADRETERKKSIASSTPQSISIYVDPALASGTKISTEGLSKTSDTCSKQ
jgi:hypothetical protein